MEKARCNTELYSNLRALLNNVKPSNFWGSHQFQSLFFVCKTSILCSQSVLRALGQEKPPFSGREVIMKHRGQINALLSGHKDTWPFLQRMQMSIIPYNLTPRPAIPNVLRGEILASISPYTLPLPNLIPTGAM